MCRHRLSHYPDRDLSIVYYFGGCRISQSTNWRTCAIFLFRVEDIFFSPRWYNALSNNVPIRWVQSDEIEIEFMNEISGADLLLVTVALRNTNYNRFRPLTSTLELHWKLGQTVHMSYRIQSTASLICQHAFAAVVCVRCIFYREHRSEKNHQKHRWIWTTTHTMHYWQKQDCPLCASRRLMHNIDR